MGKRLLVGCLRCCYAGMLLLAWSVEAAYQLGVNDPLGALLDNPQARVVLEAELPTLFQGPQIEQARGISLRDLQVYAPTLVTDDALARIEQQLREAGALVSEKPQVTTSPVTVDSRLALTLKTFPLWPEGAPGAQGERAADQPTLTVVKPDGAVSFGTAVIVAPGGGYQALASGHEGRQVADWFAARGVTAFVLSYRLCTFGYKHPVQLRDAQRALRWVRANADQYGVHPGRVGMIGFSAGGHLTAMASTLFDGGYSQASDPVERQSSCPDFAVLAYTPTTFSEVRGATQQCFLGTAPSAETLDETNVDANVNAQTPPTFLFHTTADELVSPLHAARYYSALVEAGVPAELHIFANGHHGQGLAQGDASLHVWPGLLDQWLRDRGLIGAGGPPLGSSD